jgi:hypothetical protein
VAVIGGKANHYFAEVQIEDRHVISVHSEFGRFARRISVGYAPMLPTSRLSVETSRKS